MKFNILVVFMLGMMSLVAANWQNPQQLKPGNAYTGEPCSDGAIYRAAIDLSAGKINQPTYDRIVAEHIDYKKKHCQQAQSSNDTITTQIDTSVVKIQHQNPLTSDSIRVSKYQGFPSDRNLQFEGGTESICPLRSLISKINGNSVAIYEQHCKFKNGVCEFVSDDLLVLEQKLEEKHLQIPDSSLVFHLVPAVDHKDSIQADSYFSFPLENFYFKWRNREFECVDGFQVPPDGFHCDAHEDPKLYGPNSCGNLRKAIKKLQQNDCEFAVLFPSRSTDNVFVLRSGNASVVKGLSASFFHYPSAGIAYPPSNSEKEHKKMMGHMLYQLAVFIANDANVKIVHAPNQNSMYFTLLGQVEQANYLYSFGYSSSGIYSSYQPVKLAESLQLSNLLTTRLWNNSAHQKMLLTMIKNWQKDHNSKAIITAALPTTSSLSPLEALGSPSENDAFPPNLPTALRRGKPIDVLIESPNSYPMVLRSTGDTVSTWYSKHLTYLNTPFIKYLAIADPAMHLIADSEAEKTIVFLFRQHKHALWSWKLRSSLLPKERKLLTGTNKFVLNTDRVVSEYLEYLPDASTKERNFWLDVAIETRNVIPLDLFTGDRLKNYNFLFSYAGRESSSKAYRIAKNLSHDEPIQFLNVGYKVENWATYSSRYKRWRFAFKEQLAYSHLKNLEAWYGENVMGINTKLESENFISVLLLKREFSKIPLSSILGILHTEIEIITNTGQVPTRKQLMVNFLTPNWRERDKWRANPLGLLERISQINS